MRATIWHNPHCSKSRATLALLEDRGATVTVREYLHEPPTRAELERLFARAGISAREALRRDAPRFDSDSAALEALAADPSLLERPFVDAPHGAALCRPPESALGLLQNRAAAAPLPV